ncbi:MAG: Helix-turn-helix domain [Pseudomonadota bacterium]|jgi:predicted XRE-type DNA-binding protein
MPRTTVNFKSSDELFAKAGMSAGEILIANFRVAVCLEIGKRLKQSGLTQSTLASHAGTSQANVSRIVNRDIGKLSTDLLLRVLVELGGRPSLVSRAQGPKRAG